MKATLIDKLGTDLTVVNAARVSFNKESTVFSEQDEKLLNYLAKHNHWSPFAHAQAQFHFKAPIFVARQLVKHQVGLVWNEVSRRYVDSPPEFYFPDGWRKKADNKKQGSLDEVVDSNDKIIDGVSELTESYKCAYLSLLGLGVCPEQARMILPLNTYTEWYWTGSLYAWARVFKLRTDLHAQKECQDIIKQIDIPLMGAFPKAWAALKDN